MRVSMVAVCEVSSWGETCSSVVRNRLASSAGVASEETALTRGPLARIRVPLPLTKVPGACATLCGCHREKTRAGVQGSRRPHHIRLP